MTSTVTPLQLMSLHDIVHDEFSHASYVQIIDFLIRMISMKDLIQAPPRRGYLNPEQVLHHLLTGRQARQQC